MNSKKNLQLQPVLHGINLSNQINMDIIQQTEQLLSAMYGKSGSNALKESMIFQIENGIINPLEFRIKTKMLIDALDGAIQTTKSIAMDELNKHGNRAELFGATIEQMESGVKYDYETTGDSEWIELTNEINRLNELKKERESFLKSIKQPLNHVNNDGEIVTILPPIKMSTTTMKITLK